MLEQCCILDTPEDPAFDDLTRLAAQICEAPVALISLIDGARQWFKSRVGLELMETPRRLAFCAYAILDPDQMLIVPDATQDPRFAGNELVTGPMSIRFYAGVPLVMEDGYALGSLCVLDQRPRELTAGQREALTVLARQVVSLIRLRRQNFALEEARAGREQFFTLALDLLCIAGMDGYFKRLNPAFSEVLGFTTEELLASPFASFIHPEDLAVTMAAIAGLGKGLAIRNFEVRFRCKDGTYRWLSWKCAPTSDGMMYASARDITERHEAERLLKASLAEKETLLKEIHHRVKNNLQVISSLLQLQSDGLTEPRMLALFRESQDRVRAMALIHEGLYRSGNLAAVNFGTHLTELTGNLLRSYGTGPTPVRMEMQAEPVELDIDVAVPLSLIVNELVTNAFKHGFAEGRGGTLRVTFRTLEEGALFLSIGDDGPGLPPGYDAERSPSLGLKIVRILVAQLGGRLDTVSPPGVTFSITFPRTRIAKSP